MNKVIPFPFPHRDHFDGDLRTIASARLLEISQQIASIDGETGRFASMIVRRHRPTLAEKAGELADYLAGRKPAPHWLRR